MRQFLSLLRVFDHEGVQKPGATNREFGLSGPLADLDELGVLATGLLEEVTDVGDLLRHIYWVG